MIHHSQRIDEPAVAIQFAGRRSGPTQQAHGALWDHPCRQAGGVPFPPGSGGLAGTLIMQRVAGNLGVVLMLDAPRPSHPLAGRQPQSCR